MGAQNNFKNTAQLNSITNGPITQPTTSYAAPINTGEQTFGQAVSGTQGALQGAASTSAEQGSLGAYLVNAAQGKGPSAVQSTLASATGSNNAQAAAAAAAAKGLNPAQAARLALVTGASNNQTSANQAATLKAQEEQAAAGEAGSVLASEEAGQVGQAGASTSLASAGTQLLGTAAGAQNTAQANTNQAVLGTEGLNEQAALANQSAQEQAQAANFQESRDNTQSTNALIGGVASAVGGAASMFSKGGEVPSFAELVAHHLHEKSAAQHLAKGGHVGFGPLKAELAHEPGVHNPGALAAAIGRKKYGAHKMAEASAKGVPANHLAEGGEVSQPAGVDLTDTSDVHPLTHVIQGGKVDVKKTPGPGSKGDIRVKGGTDMTLAQHLAGGGGVYGAPDLSGAGKFVGGAFQNLLGAFGAKDRNGVPMGNAALADVGTPTPAAPVQVAGGGAQGLAGLAVPDASTPPPPGVVNAPTGGQVIGDPSQPPLYSKGGKVDPKDDNGGRDNKAKNDTVPTMLSPGEVVLPRSVSHDPELAKSFVEHLLARKKKPSQLQDVLGSR